MAMILERAEVEALGFDLGDAIQAYREAIRAHALTVDVPTPSAHPIVERIIRRHAGEYRVAEMTVAPDGRNIWNEIDLLAANVRRFERLLEDLTFSFDEGALRRVAKIEEVVGQLQSDISFQLSELKLGMDGAKVQLAQIGEVVDLPPPPPLKPHSRE